MMISVVITIMLEASAQVALIAGDPAEATAAAGVIAGFCEEYREGQQMLAATFRPPQQGVFSRSQKARDIRQYGWSKDKHMQ